MKILQLKVIDNYGEEKRNIEFNSEGMSIVYGKIYKPQDNKQTSNSIGKTLLFKFISYILGRQDRKGDYPDEICGWQLTGKVLHENKEYQIEKLLGINKDIKINGQNYSYNKYLEFFDINRGINSKQILLEKRNNIISNISKNANKEDIKNFLTLLSLNELIEIFVTTKKEQEKLASYNNYNLQFNEDIKDLEQKQFILEQKKLKIEKELLQIKNRIEKLNISEDSLKLVEKHSEKSSILKEKKIIFERNGLRIERLKQLIEECDKADISYNDIIELYNQANIVIPEMAKRNIEEVQKFYDDMFRDKKQLYLEELKTMQENNEGLKIIIASVSKEVDEIANKIAESDIFKEALNLYEVKNAELINNQEEYGKVIGVIEDFYDKKKIGDTIKERYSLIEEKVKAYQNIINEYRTYVYELVNQIYEDDREAYFNIEVPIKNRIKSMPLKVTLNLKGDKGEGIGAVKNIVIDLLLFYYNDLIEYLIQDSSCFEGIDKRQTATLLLKANSIANEKNKQYIVSLNDYHLKKDDEELMNLINKNCILELSEQDLLLKKRI